jgi:putative transcriptional regulator
MKTKTLSQTLVRAAKELGLSKATVAELAQLDIPKAKRLSAREIRRIRDKARVSQGVFAALLNVSPSTVQKWEQGSVRPQNAALRLLNVIDAKGIDILK